MGHVQDRGKGHRFRWQARYRDPSGREKSKTFERKLDSRQIERLRHELGVPVRVADDPLRSVVLGSGRCVEEFATLERVLIDSRRY